MKVVVDDFIILHVQRVTAVTKLLLSFLFAQSTTLFPKQINETWFTLFCCFMPLVSSSH